MILLAIILVIMIVILVSFWLLAKLYAFEESEGGDIINGERCIRMSIDDYCNHHNPESRFM